MIKVGITGGIGSGKSFVCGIFEKLNIPCFYADVVGKKLLNTDISVKNSLIELFGNDIYHSNGTIRRKKLANIIFNDKIALQKVNSIIHPWVHSEFDNWVEKQSSTYVLQEAAILFENDQYKKFDKIITVVAPVELRIERIILRDGISREIILERINNQLSDEIKIKNSDFVIDTNNGEMILPQIINIHNRIEKYGKIW